KNFTLTVHSLAGFDRAIVTSGGVSLREVDPRTMHSKVVSNLLLAGEVLDVVGPTGGFNLQMCWSTGYCAGSHIGQLQ
ncbi:MAG: NAD(P)/FAD-dependent oxidoreductase, partial [Patescibacteria group bacterium]|nr:NAD(P)/FAD-dependent oxidoreductase [Patescibacteria group bacterium]